MGTTASYLSNKYVIGQSAMNAMPFGVDDNF